MYSVAFLLVITFIAVGYKNGGIESNPDSVSAKQNVYSSTTNTSQTTVSKISVDQLTATSAVTNLAEATNLPAAGDLREATTTLYIKKQLAQSDTEVISKPQIVQPTTSAERGIKSYTAQEGDTIDSVAAKFGVTAQTLKWANNTTSNDLQSGKTLVVPPVDGVVYTIKDGDTLKSIADKYKVDAERILLYNDLEADKPLTKDLRIVLPNGELPETERPGYTAPVTNYSSNSSYNSGGYGNMSGSSIISRSYGYGSQSSGNRYAAGNCTWYAYERRLQLGRPIGGLWGNAYSWASSARGAGYVVNNTPAVGAVIQSSSGGGGYGHVGVVESINGDSITISDMNYAGYNVVTWRTIPMSQAGSYNYIH